MNSKSGVYTLFVILFFQNIATGQNVNSDTIFVSTAYQTVLTFKSEPKAVILKGAEDFDTRTSENQVRIHPRKSAIKLTGLRVREGGRVHNFFVSYNDSMSLLDASYNFSYLGNKPKDTSSVANTPLMLEHDEQLRIFNLAMDAYTQYENAATILNYEEEIFYLKEFLRLIVVCQLDPRQYSTGKKEFAEAKIKKINDYLSRTRGASYQLEPIPYSESDLEKKYSGVDFNVPPHDQKFSKDSYPESDSVSKQILSENTKKTIVDSTDNNIKLACQSISKKEGYVYFKYGILNNDSKEFVAGAMQLVLNKKRKKTVQLTPVYISSFPIVLPGKEFAIVYVTKDYKTEDNETLVFEINDRFNKIKLKLAIPGSIVNTQ